MGRNRKEQVGPVCPARREISQTPVTHVAFPYGKAPRGCSCFATRPLATQVRAKQFEFHATLTFRKFTCVTNIPSDHFASALLAVCATVGPYCGLVADPQLMGRAVCFKQRCCALQWQYVILSPRHGNCYVLSFCL